MEDSVKAFVERQNIAHYIDQLKTETDPVQRETLLKLLAEEKKRRSRSKLQLDPTGAIPERSFCARNRDI